MGACEDVRWSQRRGAALAVAAKTHGMMEMHRVLVHASAEITQKTVQAMRIMTSSQWGACEARLPVKGKRQVVRWVDGPDKTGSNDIGDEDLDVMPGEDESVGKRGTPQLGVPELELEQPQDPEEGIQEAPPDPVEETREAPSDREDKTREAPYREEETQETPLDPEKTQGAPLDPEEETLEAPSDPEEEILEAPSDPEEETNYVAGLAAGSTDLEGLVAPARRKLPISDNLPLNNVIAHVESTGAHRRGRSSAAKYSTDDRRSRRKRRREEYVDMRQRGLDDFGEKCGGTGADSEGHAIGAVSRQQTMNALEMEEWRKFRRKKKNRVARPNDKLVVEVKVMYKINMKGGEVEKYGCRLVAQGF